MNFGEQVRLDGSTLIVAEVPSSGNGSNVQNGNVYVYGSQAGSYVQQQVLTESTPTDRDGFGAGIAIHGDLLAVYSGAAQTLRVYRRTSGTFGQVWSQAIADVGSGSEIGLAMRGDLIAIGAPLASFNSGNTTLTGAGQVLIFARQPNDTYTQQRVIRAFDAAAGMGLGRSVAISDTEVFASTGAPAASVYRFAL